MSSQSANNKRIAKNTIYMYIRMAIMMIVTLYTSRVILNTLGVEDYGIYNIIAGIVVLFAFANRTLTTGTQRFLNVAYASSNNHEIRRVFSSALLIHYVLVIIIVLLLETFGLYIVNNHLNLPSDRTNAVQWVYQIVIAITVLNALRVPFNAAIIANEKMDFYAITSTIEAILKLAILYVLIAFDYDKLIMYCFLMLFITFIMFAWYVFYCFKHFNDISFRTYYDKNTIRKMLSFSSWNIFSTLGDMAWQQGVGIVLNVFFGVTLNTVLGIANSVKSAVFQFVANIQIPANPQITKSYTLGNNDYCYKLFYNISKYSFFMMLFIALPILLNTQYILDLWLKIPPTYSDIFVKLSLIYCLIDSLTGPMWTIQYATGDIKKYSIITSLILMLNIPLAYISFKLGAPPYALYLVQILVLSFTLISRLILIKQKVGIPLIEYASNVIKPICIVIIISFPIPILVSLITSGFTKLFVTSALSVLFVGTSVFIWGISNSEREFVISYLKRKIKN